MISVRKLYHVQTKDAFSMALNALREAGAVLVDFDISLMLKELQRDVPQSFARDYEMPREIARCPLCKLAMMASQSFSGLFYSLSTTHIRHSYIRSGSWSASGQVIIESHSIPCGAR